MSEQIANGDSGDSGDAHGAMGERYADADGNLSPRRAARFERRALAMGWDMTEAQRKALIAKQHRIATDAGHSATEASRAAGVLAKIRADTLRVIIATMPQAHQHEHTHAVASDDARRARIIAALDTIDEPRAIEPSGNGSMAAGHDRGGEAAPSPPE